MKFLCESCLRAVRGSGRSQQRRRRFAEVVKIVGVEFADWFKDDSLATADERARARRHFGNWARQVSTWSPSRYKPHYRLVKAVADRLAPAKELSDESNVVAEVKIGEVVSYSSSRSTGEVVQRTFF